MRSKKVNILGTKLTLETSTDRKIKRVLLPPASNQPDTEPRIVGVFAGDEIFPRWDFKVCGVRDDEREYSFLTPVEEMANDIMKSFARSVLIRRDASDEEDEYGAALDQLSIAFVEAWKEYEDVKITEGIAGEVVGESFPGVR